MNCNVCGTANYRIMAVLKSEIDQAEYKAVKCLNCGLIFTHPMPSLNAEKLQTLYDDEYTETQRAIAVNGQTSQMLRTATHQQMDIVEQYVAKGKALNIGAMGEAITILKDRGWDLQIVEVSSYAAETARKLWGLNVITSRIEDFEDLPETYAFIKMGHVIEHLIDPHVVIKKLASMLQTGGVILIDTDNAAGLKTQIEFAVRRLLGEPLAGKLVRKLTGKNLNKRYGRLTPPEHVYSFAEKSLTRLLESAGFEILKTYKPAWGDSTWFPMANKKDFSLTERVFFLFDQLGARIGHGEVIVLLARKSPAIGQPI